MSRFKTVSTVTLAQTACANKFAPTLCGYEFVLPTNRLPLSHFYVPPIKISPLFSMPLFRFLPILLALWVGAIHADDDDDEPVRSPSQTQVEQTPPSTLPDQPVLILPPSRQASAGLVLAPVQAAVVGNEVSVSGKVLDVQDLLAQRTRYRAAWADVAVARSALTLASRNRQRITALHQQDIIAGRVLIEAESQYQSDLARSQAAERMLEDLRRQFVQTYGTRLAALVLVESSPLLDDWIQQRRVLLLVSLPQRLGLTTPPTTLPVSREYDRPTARPARFLAAAPYTDELTQGETYYYDTPAQGLRNGMRLQVWVGTGEGAAGVVVPHSAILWQSGKAWVYRQVGADRFVRTDVSEHQEYGADWRVQGLLQPGERVVVSGGQLLLSEEHKQQIPDEDDD